MARTQSRNWTSVVADRLSGLVVCACFGCGPATATGSVGKHAASAGRHGPFADAPTASAPSDLDVARLVDDARAAVDTKDYDRAARLAQQAVSADPHSYPEAYRVLGEVAIAKHEPAAALAHYEAAAALQPEQSWPVAGAAEALTALGRKEEARARLRDFIATHPAADSA